MWHRIVPLVMLAGLFALLAEVPAAAAETETGPPSRVLVTFSDGLDGKSSNKPVPGKSYRYRSRYRISAAVRQQADALAEEYDMTLVDDWPIESLQVYCVVYEPGTVIALPLLLEKLNRDVRVESAQEMHYFESTTSPSSQYNDSYAGYQHALDSMSVLQAHRYAVGRGVKIAVIDSGVDLRHEDFRVSRIRARDFVGERSNSSSTAHGTAVVSLIIASPNNGKGIVGVAPAAELTSLRACWTSGNSETARCDSLTLAKALDYAVRSPPDLINLSIAGPADPLLGRLLDKALQKGTVIVAAQPRPTDSTTAYPAGHAGVLAVSVAGTAPPGTLRAPGEQIMVALPDDGYDFRSGSSLAAANASGVIALLLEHVPDLDAARIAAILKKSQSGSGQGGEMINACRALAEIDVANICQ